MPGGLAAVKPGHPLADAGEAQRVLADLALRDAAPALGEVSGWLQSLAADDRVRLAERLALVFRLDELARPHARKLTRDFLVSPRLGRSRECHLWQANHDFWVQLAAAYDNCLSRCAREENDLDGIRSELPLLLARTLHALSARIKWDQFRYGPIPSVLWRTMGGVYLLAEQMRLSRRAVALYPGAAGPTSVEREYLKALVFHASSMDSLLPLEIEIAEGLITHLLPHFAFTIELRPDSVYAVDADKAAPPRRLVVPPQAAPTLRFFSAGAALDRLDELTGRIERGAEPAETGLGGQYSARAVLPVLRHLATYWASTPPARSYDRHRVKAILTVTSGVGNIHDRLSGADPAGEVEEWIVEDVSLGGMGAQAPLDDNEWLRIGMLLGLRPEGGENWLVGVIRRFNRDTPALGSVGIETLSKAPRAIAVESGGIRHLAIQLDPLHAGEPVRVVLPGAVFEPTTPLMLALSGESVRLDPVGQLEAGVEFEICLYRVAPPA